ncbi:chemotaxis-specific protein-glutamate methyltransferase CheB [Kaarinaea lacus]
MKIAIANIAIPARQALVDLLLKDSLHEILWCAETDSETIDLCIQRRPELLLMDLIEPGTNGVDTIQNIMRYSPCPILIVTACIDYNCDLVFQAMGAGAIDAVNTPILTAENDQNSRHALLKKIHAIEILTLGKRQLLQRESDTQSNTQQKQQAIVVVGSSSGGPKALEKILAQLPEGYGVPIVVVQHVDVQFAPALAAWLNERSALKVVVAKDGDIVRQGHVYIAASRGHLLFKQNNRLYYSVEPRETVYRPSVDVFFRSVAEFWPGPITAVLLTGMGQDGADGLLELRNRGAYTIAQNEATSAVYGMPKRAAEIGAATEVLPLDEIAVSLCQIPLGRAQRHQHRSAVGMVLEES